MPGMANGRFEQFGRNVDRRPNIVPVDTGNRSWQRMGRALLLVIEHLSLQTLSIQTGKHWPRSDRRPR